MAFLGQITTNMSSPGAQVAMLAVVVFVLLIAVKIGGFILKMLLGLAVLGGVIWWLLAK